MREGWSEEDYLILFSEEECNDKTRQYELAEYLPGYRLLGLKGWDDFLVTDSSGKVFTVPTVPMIDRYLQPCVLPVALSLTLDERFQGKIKWYVKPIAFGGDPNAEDNLSWINHDQHIQLVTWWNEQYWKVAPRRGRD